MGVAGTERAVPSDVARKLVRAGKALELDFTGQPRPVTAPPTTEPTPQAVPPDLLAATPAVADVGETTDDERRERPHEPRPTSLSRPRTRPKKPE